MKNYQINLLKKKGQKFSDKVIYFSLHYLRYIVVITQIIVIAVFFYRFKVDQEIVELKDSLNGKEEIIKVTKPLIKKGRLISFKLNQTGQIVKQQNQFISNFNYILSVIPQKITLNKVEINPSTIKLSGVTTDFRAIKALYEKIKKEQRFKEVAIDKFSKTNFGFDFLILIKIS